MRVTKGGVALSEEKESFLRFSLEESVWFQKGQEVAELLTISLDPNITIHENEQYVTIEGALQLTGEYKRHHSDAAEEDDFPLSPKFIQVVEERGDGVTEFSHRFPVDITIPHNRIHNVYDIDVEIESFDYVFPDKSCMKLTADLTITGLKGEESTEVAEKEQEIEVALRSPELEETEEPIEVKLTPPPVIEETNPTAHDLFAPFEVEARKSSEEEKPSDDPASEPLVLEKVPTLRAPQEEYPDISFSAQRKEKPASHQEHSHIEIVEHEVELESESPSHVESESSSSSSSEEIVKKKKKKISKKKGISITEFLARKEEHEDVAKLKVCIVQNGDTLDSLADRYEVTTQALMKVNQLEVTQDIYEGQVLYIPLAVAQRP